MKTSIIIREPGMGNFGDAWVNIVANAVLGCVYLFLFITVSETEDSTVVY